MASPNVGSPITMCGNRPFAAADLSEGRGLDEVVDFILRERMLVASRGSPFTG